MTFVQLIPASSLKLQDALHWHTRIPTEPPPVFAFSSLTACLFRSALAWLVQISSTLAVIADQGIGKRLSEAVGMSISLF